MSCSRSRRDLRKKDDVASALRRKATLKRRGMRLALVTAVLLTIAAPATAQPCPPIQVRNPAGNYIVPGVQGDIPYSGNLALDAYVQQGSTRPPSIIIIHGGAWTSGSRIAHIGQLLEFLTGAGYNWFALDYRLGGPVFFEDSLTDIRAAVTFIRCHAKDFRIDPNQLVLLGEDSGAHMTASLAGEPLPGVIAAVLIGGFYDLNSIPSLPRDVTGEVLTRRSLFARTAAQKT